MMLTGIGTGTAIVVVGLLALLLLATIQYRNPAAMVMWGLSVLTLLVSGTYGLGTELVWFAIMGTVILVVVGVSVRMMR